MRVRAAVAFVAVGWFLAAGCSDEALTPEPQASAPKTAAEVAPPAPAPQPSAPLRAELGTIRGTVVVGRPSMPDAGRKVALRKDGTQLRAVTTDAWGAYAFDGVEPGVPHEVVVEGDGLAPGRLTGVVLCARERRDVGTLLLGPPARIVVTVTDDRGETIAGATVEAFRAPEGEMSDLIERLDAGASLQAAASAMTDASGRASLAVAADGSWSVAARAPGRAREAIPRVGFGEDDFERSIAIVLPPAESLRGRVVGADGRPVAKAIVGARRRPPALPPHGARIESAALWQRATADAEGRFVFDELPPGEIDLVACEAGGAPSDAAAVSVPEVREVDLTLRPTATLTGRITERTTGASVPGVVVAVGPPDSNGDRRPVARITASDADGRWTLDRLPAGVSLGPQLDLPPPWVVSSADGWRYGALRGGEVRTLDFTVVRGGTITGRVTCDDAPVAGADIEAVAFEPGFQGWRFGARTRADSEGRFRVEGVRPGAVALFSVAHGDALYDARRSFTESIDTDEAVRRREVFEVASGAEVQRDVAIVRRPKDDSAFEATRRGTSKDRTIRVHGRITTSDGLPLLRARVATESGRWDGYSMGFARDVGPPGTYETSETLSENEHVLSVWASDDRHGAALCDRVEVPDGATEVTVDLVLPALVPVRGRVVSGEKPVGGAQIWRDSAMTARSREDGSFEVALPAGKTWLGVTAPGYVARRYMKLEVPHDGNLVVDLVALQPISGRVVDASGAPVAGVEVTPFDSEGDVGEPYAASPEMFVIHSDRVLPPVTGDDGTFVLADLGPGTYRLRARSLEGAAAPIGSVTTDGIDSGTRDVRIVVTPGVRIAGRVVGADGKPLYRAEVNCIPRDADGIRDSSLARETETGSDGKFAFDGLVAGGYDLDVKASYRDSLAPARRHVEGGMKDVEIALEPAGVIAGSIVNDDGTPFERTSLALQRLDEPPDDEPKWPHDLDSEWTDDGAKFRILVPPRSRHRVTFSKFGNARRKAVLTGGDDVAAGTTDLRLVAASGLRVAGVAVTPEGSPLAQADVEVVTPDGEKRRARSRDDGRFEVGGIQEATTAAVTVTLDGRVPARLRDVAAGTTDLRVVLRQGISISGRLLTKDGKPPEQRTVRALNPAEPEVDLWRATVDDRGHFEVRGLTEGDWVLESIVPG